jgi:1,4-dihydroxy-2-naphthoyl-CoA hydrolase
MARLWRADATLAELQAKCVNTLAEHLGIELTELADDYLSGRMPVDHRTCQPMGILHGGASVAFAETLASLAASAIIDTRHWLCLGQEINANHLRRVPEGRSVRGVARAFHLGARSQVWGVELFDEGGARSGVSRITMAILRR